MEADLAGGCACGAVRYRLTRTPLFVHCCHCSDCQRQTGSAFALNALIERTEIQLEQGEPIAFELPTSSGRPHDLYACPTCRTALWSDYGRRGYLSFVRVGSLDTPGALTPDVHIYTRTKLPWVVLPDGARVFENYYDMKAEWPEASLARRQAASDAAKAASPSDGTV